MNLQPNSKWTVLKTGPKPESKEVKLAVPLSRGRSARPRIPRRRRGGGVGKARGKAAPALPPGIDAVTTASVRVRFENPTSASSVAVTRGSMGACLGGVCCSVANTTVSLSVTSFRLTKLILWPGSSTSASFNVQIDETPSGAEQALRKDKNPVTATPAGVTVVRPVVWTPSKDSYLSMWQLVSQDATDQLLSISGGAGCVIDVFATVTLNTGAIAGQTHTRTTTSSISVGTWAYMPLDTSNKFLPLGPNVTLH